MSNVFIGQINIVGFNFPPRGWAFCNGQILSIAQNTALFSILGTTYGGDGRTTFALPNLQGRAPMHWGNGAGLPQVVLGEEGGVESVTLTLDEMAQHTHTLNGTNDNANAPGPGNDVLAKTGTPPGNLYGNAAPNTSLSPQAISFAGGNQPHTNLQPYLALNFCIALQGIFPSRN